MPSLCSSPRTGWLAALPFRCFRRKPKQTSKSPSDESSEENIPRGFVSVPPKWIEWPQSPPPPPQVLLDNRHRYESAMDFRTGASHPIKLDDGTPLRALYRLYEAIVLDRVIDMRNEIEWFWRKRDWPVHEIPDPADDDPARYAVLACIPSLLATAFNRLIDLGMPRDAPGIMTNEQIEEFKTWPKKFERAPEWAHNVPPLDYVLKIPHRKHGYEGPWETLEDFDDVRASEPFRDKNILIWEPHILFT